MLRRGTVRLVSAGPRPCRRDASGVVVEGIQSAVDVAVNNEEEEEDDDDYFEGFKEYDDDDENEDAENDVDEDGQGNGSEGDNVGSVPANVRSMEDAAPTLLLEEEPLQLRAARLRRKSEGLPNRSRGFWASHVVAVCLHDATNTDRERWLVMAPVAQICTTLEALRNV